MLPAVGTVKSCFEATVILFSLFNVPESGKNKTATGMLMMNSVLAF